MNQEQEHRPLHDLPKQGSDDPCDEGKVAKAAADKLAAADAAIDKMLSSNPSQYVSHFKQHGGQ